MSNLLPPNATPFERDLQDVIASSIDIPVPIRDLWNPQTCPVELLPWLAWALSVDSWSDQWNESQQRGAIAAAFAVHQHKGTPQALQQALDAIGYDIELIEWFDDPVPAAPYSFRLAVTLEREGLNDLDAYNGITSVANAAKNTRSHLTGLAVNARTNAEQFYGAAVISGEHLTIQAETA